MHHGKYLAFLFCIICGCINAQTISENDIDITGLWKGTLYNDTTRQFHRYEIGISKEKGRLSGFSHTWFLVDDKQYFGIKKLKITKAGDGKIIVEDDGLVANNYPVMPPKGVKQLNVLTLEITDSVLKLSGPFTTNRTKKYSPLTGTIEIKRQNDYWHSALLPHLKELGLEKKLSFVAIDIAKEEALSAVSKDPIAVSITSEKEISLLPPKQIMVSTSPSKDPPASTDPEPLARSGQKIDVKHPDPTKAVVIPAAAEIDSRKTIIQQTVFFQSDSLQLSLYDNGEVDGDTVSILMNGNLLMARQGLSTNAIRRTIYPDQSMDSVVLIMYAENLGTIAPNTGLLVLKDGKDIYEIRFSGDLQKSAAIILKRK